MRIYKVIQEFPNLYKDQFLFEEKGIFTDADNHIVSNTFLNFKQLPKFLTEITKYLKVGKAIITEENYGLPIIPTKIGGVPLMDCNCFSVPKTLFFHDTERTNLRSFFMAGVVDQFYIFKTGQYVSLGDVFEREIIEEIYIDFTNKSRLGINGKSVNYDNLIESLK